MRSEIISQSDDFLVLILSIKIGRNGGMAALTYDERAWIYF